MAERRMFAKTIIDSDAFIDMPISARLLYYDLGMRADDDGFVNSPKKIMRGSGASDDDMKILVGKKFIIPFESGIVVIKHWRIHNYIAKDRYNETKYKVEKSMLSQDENNAYTTNVDNLSTECIHPVDDLETQVRLGKVRLGKDRLGKDSIKDYSSCNSKVMVRKGTEENRLEDKKLAKHKYGEYQNVLLSDIEYAKLLEEFPYDYQERIERVSEYVASTGKLYKDYLATIRSWAKKDKFKNQPKRDILMEIIEEERHEQNRNCTDNETNPVTIQRLLPR